MQQSRKYCLIQPGAGIPADSGTPDSGNLRKVVEGTGTVARTMDGLTLGVTAAATAQGAYINFGDDLLFNIDEIQKITFYAKIDRLSAGLDDTEFILGLGSAHEAAPDDVDISAWVRGMAGSYYLESDDNATKDVSVDTGIDITASSWTQFVIDFAVGNQTVSPPAQPVQGGKTNIQFYVANEHQALRKVGSNTLFDLGAVTGGLQLVAGIRKETGTDQVTLTIRDIEVELEAV